MKKTRIGRPPAGENGRRVRSYRLLAIRVPEEFLKALKDFAAEKNRSQRQIIMDAVRQYSARETNLHKRKRKTRSHSMGDPELLRSLLQSLPLPK